VSPYAVTQYMFFILPRLSKRNNLQSENRTDEARMHYRFFFPLPDFFHFLTCSPQQSFVVDDPKKAFFIMENSL